METPSLPTLRFDNLNRLQPQPADAALQPGLAVLYFNEFFRHLDQMPKGARAQKEGKIGKPIPMLNHQFGKEEVFDSGRKEGVGVQLTGFLKLSQIGEYGFQARSNDGIRVSLDDHVMIDDPNVHSDRWSNQAVVAIVKPGWYSLQVLYFQRKGTAAIELYWRRPGDTKFEIIPPAAYAHALAPIAR